MGKQITTLQDKAQRLADNKVGATYIHALTNTTISTTIVDGSPVFTKKFSVADLIGNVLFFGCGVVIGDRIPTLIKKGATA